MSQLVEKEKEKQTTKPPNKYQCVLLNDDFTTWDFVIDVLQRFFNKSEEEAHTITKQIHQHGKCICAVYNTRDLAETKAMVVSHYSQTHEHPLMCIIERLDGGA